MEDFELMPIGTAPHWLAYDERITDLSKAISRYVEAINRGVKLSDRKKMLSFIEKWANELKALTKMQIQLITEDEKRVLK